MKRNLITFILCVLAAVLMGIMQGYKADDIKDPIYRVESDLEPYLRSFVNLAGVDGIDLNYIYSQDVRIVWEVSINKNSTNVATSYGRDKDEIIIVVNKERFYNRTNEGREYVMFHELGHDVLDFPHLEGNERGMMEPTAYTGFFRSYERFAKERQVKYLYQSLRKMFTRYVNKEAEGQVHNQ